MRNSRTLSSVAISTLIFASPAFAQDFCGGLGTGGQWIGGNEGASDISTAGAPQEQMALVLGGNEYVALFSLSAPTDVRVEAQGRGAADPQLDVFDASGSIMTSDDDSGGGGAARAETTLDAGTYCVAVRSYDGTPMTSFVRVGRTDHEALTEGVAESAGDSTPVPETNLAEGSCAEARPLPGSLSEGGFSGTASVNETGFWRFTLDQVSPVTVTASNSDADPVITLFDSAETYIDENDDFDGLNSQIDVVDPLPAGEYCIQVTAIDDNDLPITTAVVAYDPAAALMAQVNSGDVAPPIDGSVVITDLGSLERRTLQEVSVTNDVSWFSFEVGAGLLLAEAVAIGEGSDTWMVLYDDLGRRVSLNDDYGDSYNSLIAARVSAGNYVVGVKRLEESGAGRARIVLEHYVPAP